jgi:hypothetical protein
LALDVARIEWAFVEAFDNAEYRPLALDQVAALDGGSRLLLQPHVRLLALEYPADNLVLSLHHTEKRQTSEAGLKHEGSADAPVKLTRLRRKPTWLAAHRVDMAVYYRRLEREEFLTLMAIRDDAPLAEALAVGFSDSTLKESRQAERVRSWFATWAELGWLCLPESENAGDNNSQQTDERYA